MLGSPLQLSPRSSVEFDNETRPSAAPNAAAADRKARKSMRRTLGIFSRKKVSKPSAPELGPLSSDVESLPATPPNAITSLPLTHENLYVVPSDSEESLKKRRRSLGEREHSSPMNRRV